MVMASPTPPMDDEHERVPVIDLKGERAEVCSLIVKAAEELGFFKVINHGVPQDIIERMEKESLSFFGKPSKEKQQAGPANPMGYGCRTIGFSGDMGEVEYLLLNTDPVSISQRSQTISDDPTNFSSVVSGYIEAVRELACEILDLMAEGMRVPECSVFSRLIRDVDSDSILRLNHYPTPPSSSSSFDHLQSLIGNKKVGFGEHSDPQILTILRSNDVAGLQISSPDGHWVPVSPDPTAFCVNVGDVLQTMTNGRFVSVRHRVLTSSYKPRLSMAFFAAPPLREWITPLPQMVSPVKPLLYRPFTWAEYKTALYSLRLGDSRLDPFRMPSDQHLTSH